MFSSPDILHPKHASIYLSQMKAQFHTAAEHVSLPRSGPMVGPLLCISSTTRILRS